MAFVERFNGARVGEAAGAGFVGDSWLGRLRRAGVGALILLAVPLDMFELELRIEEEEDV